MPDEQSAPLVPAQGDVGEPRAATIFAPGLGRTEGARLCRQAWQERLRFANEKGYAEARDGLRRMAEDDTLPPRERRLAREALLADLRAGEAREVELLRAALGLGLEDNAPPPPSGPAVSLNVHAHLALTPDAADLADRLLASLGRALPGDAARAG